MVGSGQPSCNLRTMCKIMRWILTILIALMVLLTLVPWLSKFGLGHLPGDINFRLGKRRISIPLASTILIVLGAYLIGRLI